MTFSPTPPTPNTAMDWPGLSDALFMTMPNPVVTAHPSRHAISNGTSAGIGVARFSETIVYVLKVVTHPALIVVPLRWNDGVTESIPEPFIQCNTTWSPGVALPTPGPIASTNP